MLHRLKQTFQGQLALFAVFLLAAWSAAFFLNLHLPLRASLSSFAAGLGYVLPSAAVWLATMIIAEVRKGGEEKVCGLEPAAARIGAGAVLVSAFAEEPLLRGVVLTILRPFSPILGAILAGLLSFLGYLKGRRSLMLAAAEALKGLVLAAAFLGTRSIFSLIVARCGAEIVLTLAVRHAVVDAVSARLRGMFRTIRRG